MKIRALCAFSGTISMAKGDVCECTDQYVVDDLLRAGYIEAVEAPPEIQDGTEPGTSNETEPDGADPSAPDETESDISDGAKKREKRKKAE